MGEISVRDNWGPLKKHEETVKTRMGNSAGNADKKSTTTGQNGRTKRSWNMWEPNAKDNTRKNNSTTWENKQVSSGERREIKEISKKG